MRVNKTSKDDRPNRFLAFAWFILTREMLNTCPFW